MEKIINMICITYILTKKSNACTIIKSQHFSLQPIYIWSKVVCFICHFEIFENIVFHATFLVSLENFPWIGVHKFSLKLFGAIVWKLMIIELFFEWE
jgi:hypothetical protein